MASQAHLQFDFARVPAAPEIPSTKLEILNKSEIRKTETDRKRKTKPIYPTHAPNKPNFARFGPRTRVARKNKANRGVRQAADWEFGIADWGFDPTGAPYVKRTQFARLLAKPGNPKHEVRNPKRARKPSDPNTREM